MLELNLTMAAVIFAACSVETFSGFGGAMVAISLGAHFCPIGQLVPAYLVINLLMNAYIAVRHWGHVDWGLLLKQVLPFMCVGLLAGLWLFSRLEALPLKKIFGGLIVVFSSGQLLRIYKPAWFSSNHFSRWQAGFWQFGAGVCQAVYATGGPLMVYSLTRRSLPKSDFRATLCTLWALVNSLLIATFVLNGRLDSSSWQFIVWLLPGLVLGIVMGEIMHGRVNEKQFVLAIMLLLLVVGTTLII